MNEQYIPAMNAISDNKPPKEPYSKSKQLPWQIRYPMLYHLFLFLFFAFRLYQQFRLFLDNTQIDADSLCEAFFDVHLSLPWFLLVIYAVASLEFFLLSLFDIFFRKNDQKKVRAWRIVQYSIYGLGIIFFVLPVLF